MPVKIFLCYAHEDEEHLSKLKAHLRPLKHQRLIDVWHDRDISAGTEWEKEIDKHLNEAQIILLLVSPDFMNSDYCYSVEMKQAIEHHERGEARVIPVILRHVFWQETPIGRLHALPKDGKPVTGWTNLDEAFLNVAKGIRKVIEEFTPPLSTNEQLSKPAEESEISSTTSEASSTSLLTTASEEAEKSIDHLNDICLLLIKIQKRLNQPQTFKTELVDILIDRKNVNRFTELADTLINRKNVNRLEVILNEMMRTRVSIKDSQETSISAKRITLLLKIDASIKELNNVLKALHPSGMFGSLFGFYRFIIFYNNHLKKCKAYLKDMLVEIS